MISLRRLYFNQVPLNMINASRRSVGLGLESEDAVTHFTASFLAGLLGTLATNPIDVIKSRMMNQNTSRVLLGQFYHSSFDCCIKVIVIL